MNFITKFFQPKIADLQRATASQVVNTGVTPVYPRYSNEYLLALYETNASVFTVVSTLARKFGFIPRNLYSIMNNADVMKYTRTMRMQKDVGAIALKRMIKKAYDVEKIDDSPLTTILNQPNEFMGQDTFYTWLYIFKLVQGNGFVWLNRGDNDQVIGDARNDLEVLDRWIMPAQFVTIRVDKNFLFGKIVGYSFWNMGQEIRLHPEDVIHWRTPGVRYDAFTYNHLYGVSPLAAGGKLITKDEAITDSSVYMFQNGGARGVLYNKSLSQLTPVQDQRLTDVIDTKINNKAMKGAVAALPGEWGKLDFSLNAVDMDLVNADLANFKRICSLFGANSQAWVGDSTFNNQLQAKKDNITGLILPDATSYNDEENKKLLRAFKLDPNKFKIDVDASDLAELQDDMKLLTDRVMSNNTLTVDEKREALGYDPIGGDQGKIILVMSTLTTLEDISVPVNPLNNVPGFNDPASDGPTDNGDGDTPIPAKGDRLRKQQIDEVWRAAVAGK